MRRPSLRTSARSLWLRAAALALCAGAAALLVAPGCSLIEGQQDCEDSCEMLNKCGLLPSSSCGTYCTALVAGVAIAGCDDELDAQNECGKGLSDCSTATKCEPKVKAFAACMDEYCKKTPNGQGCP